LDILNILKLYWNSAGVRFFNSQNKLSTLIFLNYIYIWWDNYHMIMICLCINVVTFSLSSFHLRKLDEIIFSSNLKIFQKAFQSTIKKFPESSCMVERVHCLYFWMWHWICLLYRSKFFLHVFELEVNTYHLLLYLQYDLKIGLILKSQTSPKIFQFWNRAYFEVISKVWKWTLFLNLKWQGCKLKLELYLRYIQ
jgi:hypothetical protein